MIMVEKLAKYLGGAASDLLSDSPFNLWSFEESREDDLEKPIISYVFPQHGLELNCDDDHRIRTIFLKYDKCNGFDESLIDLPFSLTRQQVNGRFGLPSKSGKKINDPILGEKGAWDRFTMPEYTIHVQYRINADSIQMITLMRPDVVP